VLYREPSAGGGGGILAAAIQFSPERAVIGAAQELFRTLFASGTVNNDAQRFLLFTRPGEDEGSNRNAFTVVVNWQAALN
jgi:hypothetical protein